MGKFFTQIEAKEQAFIQKQQMFFVATSPLHADGHINLSPKGTDCFRILSENCVGYMDLVGSGNETSAHLLENQRITFMFCAFEGAPNILRLYGKGRTILPKSAEWETFTAHFPIELGTRQLIIADIFKVQTSCGYSVPLYDFVDNRTIASGWAERKGETGLKEYMQEKNALSLDGLPTALSVFGEKK